MLLARRILKLDFMTYNLYNENRFLITALNNHIKSLEKQLDEKQVDTYFTKSFYKNLQNFSYNNVVAISNHKFDQIFLKISALLRKKKKRLARIQIHDDNRNNSGINNQEAPRESKENQSEALDNSVDNSNGKEIKEQLNGSLRHHPDHINGVKSTGKEKKKTVAIVGDSIIRNIPSRSSNNSLKECFSIIKSFPGATTKDMRYYIKPSMARKLDTIVLHTGTNGLENNKTPSNIASEIIQLAKIIKTNGIEVAVSSLIPRGDKLSEKAKKVNIHLQEKCTTENFAIIQHTNINSKLDLFPDNYIQILKGKAF